jgi:hypothetical protein
VGIDGEAEMSGELQPDRYYLLGDAGSFYFDLGGDNEGFESPEAAAEWARTQTVWDYGAELDFSDGLATTIVLGSEYNASQAAWEAWDGEGDWPDVPGVRNFAEELGLARPAAVRTRRELLRRLKWW